MKTFFTITSITAIILGFLMFIGTFIYIVTYSEEVELPIVSIPDAVQIDDKICIGNGMFKCIQVYDINGNFVKTIPSNAGPYFYIRADEFGNIVAIRDESHYYKMPFKMSKSAQYTVEQRLPLRLLFHASTDDVMIKQSIATFFLIPILWVIVSLLGFFLLLITHLILIMEVMASKGSFWEKVNRLKDGVLRR